MIKKLFSLIPKLTDNISRAVLLAALFLGLVPSIVTGIVALNALPQLPGMEGIVAGSTYSAFLMVLAATIASTVSNIAAVELTKEVLNKNWEKSKITPAAAAFFNMVSQTLMLIGLAKAGVITIDGNLVANALLAGGILGVAQIPIFEATMALLGERSTDIYLFFKGLLGQLLTCFQDWSVLAALSLQFILPGIFSHSSGFVFEGSNLTAFGLGISFSTFVLLSVLPLVVVPALLLSAIISRLRKAREQSQEAPQEESPEESQTKATPAASRKEVLLKKAMDLYSGLAFTAGCAAWLKLACTFYPDVIQVNGPVEFFTGTAALVAVGFVTYPLRKYFSPCANGACSR